MADQLSKLLKRKSEGIAEMIVETPKAKPTPILPKKKELQKVQSKSDKFSLLDFDPGLFNKENIHIINNDF